MDKEKGRIFIDTNVFVIDLRYGKDKNFQKNRVFLDFIAEDGRGISSIFNLLEICGILSFNLNQQQISELFYYLPVKYNIGVVPSHDMDSFLPAMSVDTIMDVIYNKASLGDALIANFVKRNLLQATVFVSWDAPHFQGLLSVETLTPREFLLQGKHIG